MRPDTALFIGVLEYLVDLSGVTHWLASQVSVCVASYDPVRARRLTPQRVLELGRRKSFGYMNDYGRDEVIRLFEAAGFSCVRTDRWQSQDLFVFATREGLARIATRG
jgi:hypothetical protein